MANTTTSLSELNRLHAQLPKGEMVLDVRNPDEYAAGHIPGAMNVPLPSLPNRLGELQGLSRIYIHCKRGGRAKTARDLMANAGFENLVCVEDAGMDAWVESGYPVEK